MIKTFQSYLILWFCSILTLTLVIFSFILYFSIVDYLYRTLDQSLLTLAHTETIAAFELEPHEKTIEEPHLHISPLDHDQRKLFGISDRFLIFYTKDRKELASYSPTQGISMTANTDILNTLKIDDLIYETQYVNREFIRILYLPIVQEGKISYVVQIGTIFTNIIKIQKQLKITLFVLCLVVMFISVVTGYYIAKKAAYPIKALSQTAVKIDEKNLSERLSFTSPFEEIKQLVGIFNEMLDRIEKSFELKKIFVADASHEMLSPLTAIRGSVEVTLRRERSASEYISVMESSLEEIDRLSNLHKALLTLSKMDDKTVSLNISTFSVDKLIKTIIMQKRIDIEKKNLSFVCHEEMDMEIMGDIGMIRQLLSNLIDNAIKYSTTSGIVTISTGQENNIAYVNIKDNGEGISEKDLPNIFERFYRADNSRSRETGGTGLGLSIARVIARLHKGSVSAASKEGAGSTFTFTIPV